MARVVGAFGASHGPLLATPPDEWHQRAADDQRNPRHAFRGAFYDYPGAGESAQRGSHDELDIAAKTRRYDACQAALAELARRVAACGANAAIIIGNDQRELFRDDFTPAFLVYAGDRIANVHPDEQKSKAGAARLGDPLHGHVPPGGAIYPGAPRIAEGLVDGLIARDFDVAISYELPKPNGDERGIPHAYGFIFRRLMLDAPPPTVPIFADVGETRDQAPRCTV